jgi:5-methylcytosine-specific restriction endonuclease McrA|tara:strand:+ start:125 stop:520 length:396 start_codon:yes stop_codon:yes gene_type:complete
MNKRKGMPTKKKIYKHWFNNSFLDQYGIELGDLGDCFACGFHVRVERCHIQPINQGGGNSEENLHLLCPSCHIESEDLTGDYYWNWLSHKNVNEYIMPIERVMKSSKINPELYKQRAKDLGFTDKELEKIL